MLAFHSFLADRIVNTEAVALSPTIGWLLLTCAIVFGLLMISYREQWRRLWLRLEDPRTIGIFRFLFAIAILLNVNGLWEHFHYLFTDEGIFFTDTAREVLAKKQFAGFGDVRAGEPAGFFDTQAMWNFFKGNKLSPLFFWDSPTAFWTYLIIFEAVTLAFALGFRARVTGVLSFFMWHGLCARNPLFMEGTDAVYSCMFFYLLFAKSGHAYSIDNWLRCRKLRRKGLLQTGEQVAKPDGQETAKQALQPIYRLIPAWPRLLMMLQVATIYLFTGSAKTGHVWMRGDSLYYALNMDHFYRVPPQLLSQVFGTNVFRVMTWTVHVWQISFFLVIVGLILRWAHRQKFAPTTLGQRVLRRSLWVVLGLLALAVAEVAWPVHYPAKASLPLVHVQWIFGVAWVALMAVVGWGLYRLRNRPFNVTLAGRRYTLDLDWFCSWVLGRRVFLTLGLLFHGHIMALMNIGMFAPIMMLTYVVFLNGHEVGLIVQRLGRGLNRLAGRNVVDTTFVWAQHPSAPGLARDRAQVPGWVLVVTLGCLAGAVATKVLGPKTWTSPLLWLGGGTLVAGAVVAAIRARRQAPLATDSLPWAYGPLGRFVANTLIIYHITAVAVWTLPVKDCLSTFRTQAAKPFRGWLVHTHTAQSWNMFSPNPPRSNTFLRVLVHDTDGEVYDLNTDVYAPEQRPIPWIFNDRMRKMNRRITGRRHGKNSWYLKWHARYHCREWALQNGGEAPKKVEIVKMNYRIPTPEQVKTRGYYIPEIQLAKFGKQRVIHTAECATAPEAQLPNWMRERYGLPLLPEGAEKPWIKHRHKKWERKQKRLAKRRAQQRESK